VRAGDGVKPYKLSTPSPLTLIPYPEKNREGNHSKKSYFFLNASLILKLYNPSPVEK